MRFAIAPYALSSKAGGVDSLLASPSEQSTIQIDRLPVDMGDKFRLSYPQVCTKHLKFVLKKPNKHQGFCSWQ
jgi:hypothetical protein